MHTLSALAQTQLFCSLENVDIICLDIIFICSGKGNLFFGMHNSLL